MNKKFEEILYEFVNDIVKKDIGENCKGEYIYNEFSLQHELGMYLRKYYKNKKEYKIKFEKMLTIMALKEQLSMK